MLFYPSLLQPENIVFSALNAQTFTWQPNGSPMTSFRVLIWEIATVVVLAYDSGTITSTVPSHIVPGSSLSNNKNYAWAVIVTSGTESIQSEFISIRTAIAPTVTLASTPTVDQSYTFTTNVTLATGVSIQKYNFILYDVNNNIITDYGEIYGLTPSQLVTGLISGTDYKIECIVYDQNNQSGTTGKVQFQVNYTVPNTVPFITLTVDDDLGSMTLDWTKIVRVTGVVTGTYHYENGKILQGLYLDAGSYLTFTETIPEYFTINLWLKLAPTFIGDIIVLGSGATAWHFGYDGQYFYYQMGSFITGSQSIRVLPAGFFSIGIKYGKMIITAPLYTEII